MNPVCREARREDIADIVRFQIAMADETENLALDGATVLAGVTAVFDDPQRGVYRVVEAQGRILASLLITSEWSDWRNGEVWWIQSVYVIPEWRGKGLFRLLYESVQNQAAGRADVSGLRLYVEKRNVRAQKTYAKLGMSPERYHMYEWMKNY